MRPASVDDPGDTDNWRCRRMPAKAPGERDFGSELLTCESLCHALAPDGIFVLEHLPHAKLKVPPAYECFRDKAYGATAVAFLRHAEPAS